MRGKLAKQIRKEAKAQALTAATEYTTFAKGRIMTVTPIVGDAFPFKMPDQIVLKQGCQRWVQQRLKALHRQWRTQG